ncbi:hypothetical protein L596_005444 [Steinernema carpocapsae]|uniref:Uncharacterized protein n=1 Tax=Steinernema carpocapsae TaxID=34508 RepID=A0A4V6I8Q2_STECR|nr:hypothetical protein L596_005444 [Steinernema carpocapsae]
MVSDSPGVPLLAAEEDGQHLRVPREDGQRHVQFKIGEAGAGCSPPGSPTADLNILQELLSTRVNYVNGMVMEEITCIQDLAGRVDDRALLCLRYCKIVTASLKSRSVRNLKYF